MKKMIFVWILLISVVTMITGCTYEDGPIVSFRSKASRMMFSRSITYYAVNGQDSLSGLLLLLQDSFPRYNGLFEFQYEYGDDEQFVTNGDTGYNLIGGWFERDRFKQLGISLRGKNPFNPCCWNVSRLTSKSLWLQQKRNNDMLELKFEE